MFTLHQIESAHAKVKSGADFPQYVQDLISLGVLKYTVFTSDGRAEYTGKDDYCVWSYPEYSVLEVAGAIDIDTFKHCLKRHQQGGTDYFTFCEDSAQTGVGKWIVDVIARTCTYYGKSGEFILKEDIPL